MPPLMHAWSVPATQTSATQLPWLQYWFAAQSACWAHCAQNFEEPEVLHLRPSVQSLSASQVLEHLLFAQVSPAPSAVQSAFATHCTQRDGVALVAQTGLAESVQPSELVQGAIVTQLLLAHSLVAGSAQSSAVTQATQRPRCTSQALPDDESAQSSFEVQPA